MGAGLTFHALKHVPKTASSFSYPSTKKAALTSGLLKIEIASDKDHALVASSFFFSAISGLAISRIFSEISAKSSGLSAK